MAPRRLTVPHDAPARLDAFLARALPGFSKQQLHRLLADGKVKVNGKKAKPLRRIMGGEEVELELAAPEKPKSAPSSSAQGPKLTLLRDTKDLVVVDKPAGFIVETEGRAPSIQALVAAQVSGLDVGGAHQPGVVHRLDKDTTGCLLFAKTDEVMVALQRAFDEKRVKKTYLALVVGTPPETAKLDQPYGRHPEDPRKYTTRWPTPRRARLSWKKVKQFETTALLEIDLDTGRTHQIRAQLADAGHPLLGDWLYGTKDDRNLAPRVLLHAWKLELSDPELGFRVESPMPPELS